MTETRDNIARVPPSGRAQCMVAVESSEGSHDMAHPPEWHLAVVEKQRALLVAEKQKVQHEMQRFSKAQMGVVQNRIRSKSRGSTKGMIEWIKLKAKMEDERSALAQRVHAIDQELRSLRPDLKTLRVKVRSDAMVEGNEEYREYRDAVLAELREVRSLVEKLLDMRTTRLKAEPMAWAVWFPIGHEFDYLVYASEDQANDQANAVDDLLEEGEPDTEIVPLYPTK